MSELVLSRQKINVKVDNQVYKVNLPTGKDIRRLRSSLKNVTEDLMEIDVIIEFLDGLGFPSLVAENLDLPSLQTLVEHVSGKKN